MEIKADSKEQVRKAIDKLVDCFKDFEDNNESFYYEVVINGDIPCFIRLDFSIEDWENGYYVADILYYGEVDNSIPSVSEFCEAKTVNKAKDIVEMAVLHGLSKGNVGTWETYSEESPDLTSTVLFNPEALGG